MKRRKFTSKFKTKVVLEALKERNSLSELAQKYELSPAQISSWKKSFLANSEVIFEQKTPKINESDAERDRLLKAIGELKVENDFLKKILK
ncbi:MAG TPA: transposase [Bacteroidetes bacterium]|nr:transposase [Bacteroidota bacterium]